jgi:hypothetical protein
MTGLGPPLWATTILRGRMLTLPNPRSNACSTRFRRKPNRARAHAKRVSPGENRKFYHPWTDWAMIGEKWEWVNSELVGLVGTGPECTGVLL